MRYEWRRDFSNRPSFLSAVQGVLSKEPGYRHGRADLVVGTKRGRLAGFASLSSLPAGVLRIVYELFTPVLRARASNQSGSSWHRRRIRQEITVQDLIFVAITIAFFLVAIAYVRFCGKVK